MNSEIERIIYRFLKEKDIDENWKLKVVNSVRSVEIVFNTEITVSDIFYQQVEPNNLWVICEDEMDFTHADEIEKKLSAKKLAPITVVEINKRNIIYMGSVRAILFCRYQKNVDCIVIKINAQHFNIHNWEARKRLSEFAIY